MLINLILIAYRKVVRKLRAFVFLRQINSSETSVKILGNVFVNATNVRIGKNVTIYPNVYFWGDGEIIIGDNVDIGIGTVIFAKKRVYIGNNTIIAAYCYIIDSNHGIKKGDLISRQPLSFDTEGIFIGEDVWIAAGSKIIKGGKLERGSIVGAMSLVNKVIGEDCVAAGIPAKIIKKRA